MHRFINHSAVVSKKNGLYSVLTKHDIAISLHIQYDRDTQVTKLLKRDIEVFNISTVNFFALEQFTCGVYVLETS